MYLVECTQFLHPGDQEPEPLSADRVRFGQHESGVRSTLGYGNCTSTRYLTVFTVREPRGNWQVLSHSDSFGTQFHVTSSSLRGRVRLIAVFGYRYGVIDDLSRHLLHIFRRYRLVLSWNGTSNVLVPPVFPSGYLTIRNTDK